MKYVIYILLAAIVVSLGSGLYYLRREDADSPKMLRALQVRVALSLILVVVLVASFFFGWIEQPARLRKKGTVTLTPRVEATIPLISFSEIDSLSRHSN